MAWLYAEYESVPGGNANGFRYKRLSAGAKNSRTNTH